MDSKKMLRLALDKKFRKLRKNLDVENPSQGWIKTIRESFGMTTTQLAKKLGISQPRIIYMEKNEQNLKISTLKKIANSLNCKFVYALVPRDSIDNIMYSQAKKRLYKF